jgi:hypothetical protein
VTGVSSLTYKLKDRKIGKRIKENFEELFTESARSKSSFSSGKGGISAAGVLRKEFISSSEFSIISLEILARLA